jgi:hypothetical protein
MYNFLYLPEELTGYKGGYYTTLDDNLDELFCMKATTPRVNDNGDPLFTYRTGKLYFELSPHSLIVYIGAHLKLRFLCNDTSSVVIPKIIDGSYQICLGSIGKDIDLSFGDKTIVRGMTPSLRMFLGVNTTKDRTVKSILENYIGRLDSIRVNDFVSFDPIMDKNYGFVRITMEDKDYHYETLKDIERYQAIEDILNYMVDGSLPQR